MNARLQSETGLVFKQCPACGAAWTTRDHFLGDPGIRLVGYQVDFREFVAGFFLFNHQCGDTLSIPANIFHDLYEGPVFAPRAAGADSRPELCVRENDLDPCPPHCECGFVREVVRAVCRWPKAS